MIVRFTYKDPDHSIRDVMGRREITLNTLTNEEAERLDQLGVGNEYVTIEVDTITGHTRVVP